MKKSIQTITLTDQVEERIIEYIKNNNLIIGDSLPNEMQLSEKMGVSRNVVREALSRLKMLGLIQSRTNRGIILTEPPLLNGFSKILDPQLLSTKTIKDLMGMRLTLETGITDFIFTNITESDINELEEIVARQILLGINFLSVEDEMKFHMKIYQIAGNQFIMKFQELMHPVFVFSKQNYENYFEPISRKLKKENKIITHENILEKLRIRDTDGYRHAIRMHLRPYWEFIYNYND